MRYAYSDLPEGAKKSLLQFDLLENEFKGLSQAPSIEAVYKEHYPEGIEFKEIPMEEFTSWLFLKCKPIHYCRDWEDYRTDYEKYEVVPDYPEYDRYAVLVSEDYTDIVVDGWHRLVSYSKNNHATVPVLFYKET